MRNIIDKIGIFWCNHACAIAVITTGISIWAIAMMIMLGSTCVSLFSTMHDMEVQLAAHGVEWALYTPAP